MGSNWPKGLLGSADIKIDTSDKGRRRQQAVADVGTSVRRRATWMARPRAVRYFLTSNILTSIIVALAVFQSAGVLAQSPSQTESEVQPEALERARSLFTAGNTAFEGGQFDEAVRLFIRSFELSDRPLLLYNIAIAFDRGGHDEEALSHYIRFLEAVPDSRNAPYIQGRIEVLERQVESRPNAAPNPYGDEANDEGWERSERPSRPTETRSETGSETTVERTEQPLEDTSTSIVGPVVLLSLAGVSAGVATALAVTARGLADDLELRCPNKRCHEGDREDVEQMGNLALASDILFGVAIASAITGIVLLIMGSSDTEEPPALNAGCVPGACMMTINVQY